MIPLRDNIPSRRLPVVTVTLIIANVLVFFYQLMLGRRLPLFFNEFAVIPYRYFHDAYVTASGAIQQVGASELAVPLVTSMFLHGGWLHLGGNMLYLWIFGDNVEDRMGHFKFLVFYLLCGLAASGAHILTNAGSRVPSLGASGAIAGVLSGYLVLYPRARVLVLLPLWWIWQTFEVPALLFLGFWFVQQFFYGLLALGPQSAQTGGVAWWAHIGGFVAGAVLVWVFAEKAKRRYQE